MSETHTVVFCDTTNTEIDEAYAEELREAFRRATGWKVEPGTRIHTELGEFSKGYSRDRRDVVEVVVIFRMAQGI